MGAVTRGKDVVDLEAAEQLVEEFRLECGSLGRDDFPGDAVPADHGLVKKPGLFV